MTRYLWTAIAVAAVAVSPASAQELPVEPLPLTVDQAVSRALSISEEVRTARAEREVTEAHVVQARSGALPQVSAAVQYDRTLASIFDGLDAAIPGGNGADGIGALPFGRPNSWIGALQISQPLYTGGRLQAGLAMARSARAAAEFGISEAEAEIALDVRTAYFRTVLAAEIIQIAREAYELADAQLRQVELFLQQGTASEFDVLSARVERDNLQPAIVEAENAERVSGLNLKRLINIPAEQPVELVTPLDPLIEDVDREALRAAVTRRPALLALDETIDLRENAIRLARAERIAYFSPKPYPKMTRQNSMRTYPLIRSKLRR
jgi:outer membrane protein